MVLPSAPELIELAEGGKSHEQIAEMYGSTRQAVSIKIRRWNESKGAGRVGLLPWSVAVEHQRSTVFDAAAAYAKWKIHGREVNENEKREAEFVEKAASDLGMVLIYDRERGFQWRSRRSDDIHAIAAK